MPALMTLKVLVPHKVFVTKPGVARIVMETHQASFGILPHRRDCVAALSPGILVYEAAGAEETYVAVDEGVLVKTGLEVRVSVRRAISGTSLESLHDLVNQEFMATTEQEQSIRTLLAKLETGFLRRFASFEHE
jgi:F-type H+-transporting ATPase subunit epsilon